MDTILLLQTHTHVCIVSLSLSTETWYIINTIVLVLCLRRKQYNEDKQHK